jgi:hypothetical protein
VLKILAVHAANWSAALNTRSKRPFERGGVRSASYTHCDVASYRFVLHLPIRRATVIQQGCPRQTPMDPAQRVSVMRCGFLIVFGLMAWRTTLAADVICGLKYVSSRSNAGECTHDPAKLPRPRHGFDGTVISTPLSLLAWI